jgi:hypothetical protein
LRANCETCAPCSTPARRRSHEHAIAATNYT